MMSIIDLIVTVNMMVLIITIVLSIECERFYQFKKKKAKKNVFVNG